MPLYAERSPYDDSVYYITDPNTGQTGTYDTRGLTYFEQDPYIRTAIADYHRRMGFFNPETGGPWWDLDYVVGGAPTHFRDVGPWRNPEYQDPEYFQQNAGNLSMDDLRRVIMAIESGSMAANDPQTVANQWWESQQPQQQTLRDKQFQFLDRMAEKRAAEGKPIPFSSFFK